MRKIFPFASFLFLLLSCKKESDKKYCWQAFDPAGSDVTGLVLCDKTAVEAEAQYPQYWFYKQGENKYCWQTLSPQGRTGYLRRVPESMVEKMKPYGGYSFTKIDCESFCIWTYHDRFRSKITGLYSPSRQNTEVHQRDSCGRLFTGRVVVLKETADSIYTREFIRQEP